MLSNSVFYFCKVFFCRIEKLCVGKFGGTKFYCFVMTIFNYKTSNSFYLHCVCHSLNWKTQLSIWTSQGCHIDMGDHGNCCHFFYGPEARQKETELPSCSELGMENCVRIWWTGDSEILILSKSVFLRRVPEWNIDFLRVIMG